MDSKSKTKRWLLNEFKIAKMKHIKNCKNEAHIHMFCDKVMRTAFPLTLTKTIIKRKTRRHMKLARLHTIQLQSEQLR